jgi:hypothetical protein
MLCHGQTLPPEGIKNKTKCRGAAPVSLGERFEYLAKKRNKKYKFNNSLPVVDRALLWVY